MQISICLTDLGELSLSSNVDIYSNWDNFTNPIYIGVPVSSLYGANCSFIATVPNDTTQLLFNDPIINCNTYLPIESGNVCVDCNLRFNTYSATSISRIIAGILIDDCSGTTITDYIIDWYGPNSSTNIGYTSGFGNAFTGYSFTHPLTGNSAIFAQSGTYFPKIRKIKINGITYSQSGGTGSALANLDCITTTTITVLPFTCTNGVSSLPQYTHQVNFSAQSNGVPPISLDATFELSSTTKYFSFAFRAFEIPDTLTLTFSGSAYSSPIVIESIKIGTGYELQNPPFTAATFSPNVVTKSAATQDQGYIPKVLCLTGLTINNGDKIIINVTPNQNNFQTDWGLFFNGCITNFDCDHCFKNPAPNFKISGSTIALVNGSCNSKQIKWRYSACTNDYYLTDFYYGYFFGTGASKFNNPSIPWVSPGIGTLTQNGITSINQTTFFRPFIETCNLNGFCDGSCTPFCSTSNNNYIRYKKSNTGIGGTGLFEMYFSNISDFNFYYNLVINRINFFLNQCFPIFVNDPSQVGYFKYFELEIPSNVSGNVECGDGNIPSSYYFHVTTQVTTGFTTYYELKLTMPTIINLIPPDICYLCDDKAEEAKNFINNSSTGTTNILDIVSNRGSRYVNPETYYFVYGQINSNFTWSTINELYIPRYLNETYMYSGSPLTLIPSLTAKTCDLDSYMEYVPQDPTKNTHYYRKQLSYYNFYILNQLRNIVRINNTGLIDTTLNSSYGFNLQVSAVGLQSTGEIICGGSFTSYNFNVANRIIKLNNDGSVDSNFLLNIGTGPNSSIRCLAIQSDDKIIIGGDFTSFNGFSANRIIRLNSDGTIDTAFLTNIGIGFQNLVTKIKLQTDGKIICCGEFLSFNGISKNFLTRLNTDGTNDATFTYSTQFNGSVRFIDVQSDGKILVGGNFTNYGATQAKRFTRLTSAGALDSTFNTSLGSGFNNSVRVCKVQNDGDILVSGDFTSFNGTNVNRLIRLTSTGLIDNVFLTNIGTGISVNNNLSCPQGFAHVITQQSDNKILIGGEFLIFNSTFLRNILRLNLDGTIDSSFNIGNGIGTNTTFNNPNLAGVYDIGLQNTGEILTVGIFSFYDTYPNNFNNFGIATRLSFGTPEFKIYEYSGGTVTYSDPTYIV